jgi:trimeric autotransporter adhesin
MKTKLHLGIIALALLALSTLNSQLSTVFAQGTAFTYQGRLFDNTNAANGSYALRFTLYPDATTGMPALAGPLALAPVAVSNGLFTVTLDFGPGWFTGPPRWLQIESATNSANPLYLPMTPRQQLTPAPYAIFANTASNLSGTLPTAQLNGTVLNSQLASNTITINAGAGLSGSGSVALGASTTLTNTGVLSVTGNADITASPASGNVVLSDTATSANTANTIVKRDGSGNFSAGTITGNGGGLTNVNAATVNGLSASNFWHTTGNSGTTPGVNYLGTTDNQPLELWLGGQRALRLEPGPSLGEPNVIGGSSRNSMLAGTYAATIGGGTYNTISGGTYATIGGGNNNTISGGANATIGGGGFNTNSGGYATIGGGAANTISGGQYTTIGGGINNTISGGTYATIGGGNDNTASGTSPTIGGGNDNTASGAYSAIPGGFNNVAQGQCSFAAGQRAKALYDGCFVWADSQNADFSSTANDQFLVRAQGGVQFNALNGGVSLNGGNGGIVLNGGSGNVSAQADNLTLNATNGGVTLNGAAGGVTVNGSSGGVTLNGPGGIYLNGGGSNVQVQANNVSLLGSGGGTATLAAGNGSLTAGTGGVSLTATTPGGVSLTAAAGGVNVAPSTSLNFGNMGRQMINLYSSGTNSYGIGVQYLDMYFRASGSDRGGFCWFQGGVHSGGNVDPGGGTIMMQLDGDSALWVHGNINGNVNDFSDRNMKENFTPIDPLSVLAKVAALPITGWNFTNEPAVKHIGPMAQDWYATFNVGPDDKRIAVVDEGGVALAAIQGLNQKLEDNLKAKDARITQLENEVSELKSAQRQTMAEWDARFEVLQKRLASVTDKTESTLTAAAGAPVEK